MTRGTRWKVAAVFLGCVVPTPAFADAISPEPLDCPPGSTDKSDHRGETCVPTTCETADDCKPTEDYRKVKIPWACVEQPLCVEHMIGSDGWHAARTGDVARRVCATDANCVRPETCVVAKRCVQSEPEPVPEPKGCSCLRASASMSSLWSGAILVGVCAVRRRRRVTTG